MSRPETRPLQLGHVNPERAHGPPILPPNALPTCLVTEHPPKHAEPHSCLRTFHFTHVFGQICWPLFTPTSTFRAPCLAAGKRPWSGAGK